MIQFILKSLMTLAIGHVLVPCAAQSTEYVREMFGEDVDVEWMKELDGVINDMHPMALTIGYSGGIYRGLVEIDGISDPMEVVGEERNGVVALQEIDDRGLITGHYFGYFEEDEFSGQWWSDDLTRSADIRLRASGLVYLQSFEPTFYVFGESPGSSFEGTIAIESPYVVSGTWQKEDGCVRLLGECNDILCKTISLEIMDGSDAGSTISMEIAGKKSRVTGSQQGRPFSFESIASIQYPIERIGKLGYAYMLDYTYPVVSEGEFDSWLAGQLESWYDTSSAIALNDDRVIEGQRWSNSATAWTDLFLVEDRLISGMITFYDLEKKEYVRRPFIYDSIDDEEILLDYFSKRDGELLTRIQQSLDTVDDSADFRHAMMTETGFVVCTDFDPVFGDQFAFVPYSDVESYMRKKSILTKLSD